jgi:hypothetical protein
MVYTLLQFGRCVLATHLLHLLHRCSTDLRAEAERPEEPDAIEPGAAHTLALLRHNLYSEDSVALVQKLDILAEPGSHSSLDHSQLTLGKASPGHSSQGDTSEEVKSIEQNAVQDTAIGQHSSSNSQPTAAWDWLYGYATAECQEGGPWDNNVYSTQSRVFLPLFFAGLVAAVVATGRAQHSESQTLKDSEPHESGEADSRNKDMDWVRILCVACIVTEHSGGWLWSNRNWMLTSQWVLQFLFIISGACFMISKKSCWQYIQRLSILFIVGVSANWMADVYLQRVKGASIFRPPTLHDIYQMWYVAVLMMTAVVADPLRQTLSLQMKSRDERIGLQNWIPLIITGVLTACTLAFFLIGKPFLSLERDWRNESTYLANIINNTPLVVIQIAGIMFLSHLACLYRANDVLPWILLAHIFVPRVVIPYSDVGFIHNVELIIFGMVARACKIRGQDTLRFHVQNYWPLCLFVLLILGCPDLHGRCDLHPAFSIWVRLRFYSIEMALSVCLAVGVFKTSDPLNATKWLNLWALSAYCFHYAWAEILPIPYGALFTYSTAFVFYAFTKTTTKECQDVKQHKDSMISTVLPSAREL